MATPDRLRRRFLLVALILSLGIGLRADQLNPEFPTQPPETNAVPLFALAAAGEPAGTPVAEEEGEWELLYPRTTYTAGGILGGILLYLVGDSVDVSSKKSDPPPLTAAQLAAQQQAAAALGTGTPNLTRRLLISGVFAGNAMALDCGSFTPALTFSGAFADLGSGAISDYASSATCAPLGSAQSGRQWTWRQVADNEILVTGSDPFYVGRLRVSSDGILTLPNGIGLTGGAVQEVPVK